MHVKFTAEFTHKDNSKTKFMALDKVIGYRNYLEVLKLTENLDCIDCFDQLKKKPF